MWSRVLLRAARGRVLAAGALVGLLGGRGLRHAQVPLPAVALPTGRATPADVAAPTARRRRRPPAPPPPRRPRPQVQAALAGAARRPRGWAVGPLGQVVDARRPAPCCSTAAASDTPVAPASTAKLLTAAAVLHGARADRPVRPRGWSRAAPGAVVLVGGGDPTLSAAAAGAADRLRRARPGSPTWPPRCTRLARGTPSTASLRRRLGVHRPDRCARAGRRTTSPSEYVAPITAAMVDGGRDAPAAAIRVRPRPTSPPGQALAAALGGPGRAGRGTAHGPGRGAAVLGAVQSAPVLALVEQMLTDSDNVIAEVLGRQVADRRGGSRPPSPAPRPAIRDGAAGARRRPRRAWSTAAGCRVDDRLSAPPTLAGVAAAPIAAHRPAAADRRRAAGRRLGRHAAPTATSPRPSSGRRRPGPGQDRHADRRLGLAGLVLDARRAAAGLRRPRRPGGPDHDGTLQAEAAARRAWPPRCPAAR